VGCVLGAAHLLSADVAEKMAVICDVESGTGNYESYESDCPCLLAGVSFSVHPYFRKPPGRGRVRRLAFL
jgi:hypothetical protein